MYSSRSVTRVILGSALCLSFTAIFTLAETARYIPVTPKNTDLTDGSPLPDDLGSCGWKWRPDKGNGGVFESVPPQNGKSAIMMTYAKGLEPGTVYEVFGYFWADGFDKIEPELREQRPAQFGVTLATLQTFDGKTPPVDGAIQTWMVTPGSTIGDTYGYAAAIEADQPLEGLPELKHQDGSGRLIRAQLGLSKADKDGTLPVFFADYPYKKPAGPAWIDGLAVRRAKPDMVMDQGFKAGTRLHLALRAGDSITMKRELDAEADVNVLDEEGLTPLFYAAAAGDARMTRQLLGKGANPNQSWQSIPPLAAAATASSVDVVKLLLDAGAEVPLVLQKGSGKLAQTVHPAYLHPVIAAIRAGSLPVLRLLMEHAPGLDIQVLVPSDQTPKTDTLYPPSGNFILDAMIRGEWELAAFLIDHECYIQDRAKGGNIYLLDYNLMARASAGGKEAVPAVEALLRRGIPQIRDVRKTEFQENQARGYRRQGFATLEPWDGLSAAIWSGNTQLTRRFLSNAGDVTPRYQDELMMIALYGKNQELIDMVRNQFPKVAPFRWKPEKSGHQAATMRDNDLRMFIPRTTSPPQKPPGKQGEHVLAVISSPAASGPGAALSAIASGKNHWKVVDRELIESTLEDAATSKPWLEGKHSLSNLGDRLSADTLIIVDVIKGQSANVYSFEVIEVATGLAVHREHIYGQSLSPDKDMSDLLERAARALDAAARNERHQAITLLSFSARDGLPNQLTLAKTLRAAVQSEVDSTPGLISLTRAQSSRLVEEQSLQGKNTVWGASHLIEGAISPVDDGKIKVALRLETLRNGKSVKTDAEAIGDINSLSKLVFEAWQKLFGNTEGVLSTAPGAPGVENDALEHALLEAQRLLREAEWLYAVGASPEVVLPLIESASALGAPPSEIIPMHLDCLYRRITTVSNKRFDTTIPEYSMPLPKIWNNLDKLPLVLDVADHLAYEIPKARELLHQAEFYFDRYGEVVIQSPNKNDYNYNVSWNVIIALSYIRSAIYKNMIDSGTRDDYTIFCAELDLFTKKYFQVLNKMGDEDHRGKLYFLKPLHHLLADNPELRKGLAEVGARTKNIRLFIPEEHPQWNLHSGRILAKPIIEHLADDSTPRSRLRKAEMLCLLSKEGDKDMSLRNFIDAVPQAPTDSHGAPLAYTHAMEDMLKRKTPGPWFGSTIPARIPAHGADLLPTLLHEPRMAPDYYFKFFNYMMLNDIRNADQMSLEKRKDWYQRNEIKSRFIKIPGQPDQSGSADLKTSTLHASCLWELISGYTFRNVLEKQGGGRPTSATTSISGKLLADFSIAAGRLPGYACWPLVDSDDPGLLWMFYFTTGENVIPEHGIYNRCGPVYRNAWLLAYDCVTGKVMHQIDLKKEAGKIIGRNLDAHPFYIRDMAFDQTKTRIMTNMMWIQMDGTESGHHMCSLIIDKKSGQARMLPKGTLIRGNANQLAGEQSVGVVGIGEDFYFLDSAEMQKRGMVRSISNGRNSLFRVSPDMKVMSITEYGRRPEMTPFDPVDREPESITISDGKLVVFNQKKHAFFYDPGNQSWEKIVDFDQRFGNRMSQFTDRQRHAAIGSNHEIRDGKISSGWKVDNKMPMAIALKCIGKRGKILDLKVNIDVPEDYRSKTFIRSDYNSKVGDAKQATIPFEKNFDPGAHRVVVLNQTDTDLIVALRTGNTNTWQRPSYSGAHLPFLWKIPKKELLDNLNKEVNH